MNKDFKVRGGEMISFGSDTPLMSEPAMNQNLDSEHWGLEGHWIKQHMYHAYRQMMEWLLSPYLLGHTEDGTQHHTQKGKH